MAHPNEDLIRKGYAAFQSGDMATLGELFADDVVWHAQGRNQLSGTFRGKEEVFGIFEKVFELSGGSFKLDLHAVLADYEHTVALARSTGEREGKKLDDNTVQVFHVSGGKVTEQWLHPGDVYARDESSGAERPTWLARRRGLRRPLCTSAQARRMETPTNSMPRSRSSRA